MKIFRKVLLLILLIVFIVSTIFIISGYSVYKDAINEISLKDKVAKIQSDSSYIKVADLPKDYLDAVVAIEDHRFEKHNGIDIRSLGRALFRNIQAMDIVEGGSTITQQLSKNIYFTQKQELTRKIAEVFLAFDLEKNYDKDIILELYVNTNFFGSGYYGIYEASKGYYHKEPKDLTLEECAILAGIPNAPSIYSLDANPDLAKQRGEQVLEAMQRYVDK